MVLLSQLERAYKETFHKATPHREVDFKIIRSMTGEKDPEVWMALVFIEEHNTGYDGLLERYLCNVGKQKLVFQIDLLPGFIHMEPTSAVAGVAASVSTSGKR